MVKIPPPVWAMVFLIVAAMATYFFPGKWAVDLAVRPLGLVLVIGGLAMAIWANRLFRIEDTEVDPASPTNRVLVQRGPYRITRNPMYTGLILLTLGIAFSLGAPLMFAVPVLVFVLVSTVHIPFEEAKMSRQFGEVYADYRRRVRRWI